MHAFALIFHQWFDCAKELACRKCGCMNYLNPLNNFWQVVFYTVTVLWREEGCTMKYSLNQREILWAKPEEVPKGSGYISLYFLTWVTIQTFSITYAALPFLEDQYWKSWFSVLLGNTGKYCPVDWAILES